MTTLPAPLTPPHRSTQSSPQPRLRSTAARTLLAAEFFVLCFGVPTILYLNLIPLPVLVILAILALFCTVWLLADPSFDRASFGRLREARAAARPVLLRFLVLGAIVATLVALFIPERFFELPRSRPMVWAIIMLGYPIFSVYPQEIIYRAFVFHRYAPVFTSRATIIAASAGAFAYMHIIFNNWIAVTLSLIGGVLFGATYSTKKSLVAAWLDHAVWGCFVFTIGLGWFFIHAHAAH